MLRRPVRFVLALLFLVGVGTTAAAQDPVAPPCKDDKSPMVEISVASDATVDPDCVIIKKGNAVVVWSAGSDAIKTVVIKFDRAANPDAPDDPVCTAAECVLEKVKHAQKEGEFAYFVWVENQDGTKAGKDPVLIIKP